MHRFLLRGSCTKTGASTSQVARWPQPRRFLLMEQGRTFRMSPFFPWMFFRFALRTVLIADQVGGLGRGVAHGMRNELSSSKKWAWDYHSLRIRREIEPNANEPGPCTSRPSSKVSRFSAIYNRAWRLKRLTLPGEKAFLWP